MKKKNIFTRVVLGSLLAGSVLASATFSITANAGNLTPQDSMVSTTFDKSVINGSLLHDADGNLIYDKAGNARFAYTGQIYAVQTNASSGELTGIGGQIGSITGEAAFPKQFVAMTAGINSYMQAYLTAAAAGTTPPQMGQMPSIVPWTCNHCVMNVNGTTYISIVDALDPYEADGITPNPYYSEAMADSLDKALVDGSTGALNKMRMDGRAFTGVGPASFDPVGRTVSVRMAGCSALVAISGPEAGKIGTLCMNATATFNVSDAMMDTSYATGYDPKSQITANGSSNCVTVMQPMPAQ